MDIKKSRIKSWIVPAIFVALIAAAVIAINVVNAVKKKHYYEVCEKYYQPFIEKHGFDEKNIDDFDRHLGTALCTENGLNCTLQYSIPREYNDSFSITLASSWDGLDVPLKIEGDELDYHYDVSAIYDHSGMKEISVSINSYNGHYITYEGETFYDKGSWAGFFAFTVDENGDFRYKNKDMPTVSAEDVMKAEKLKPELDKVIKTLKDYYLV
ncbi:hypothetical protein SAMN02910447_03407 [Ruminococcus sp. YE71]|uniref:hypothetical protein n=1 Tax=unclassified Ruminococcus TaxID=2608920 RepID=UPI00088C8147|nr:MULTISPECIES: hypothetical protein [unclassified Ruminococcus]SDA31491.1 hypothetical protein SAMN02910446_03474 [Ruminococcus sp. YE78]SFW51768.1 hypothetical protein SAMN02910447_03407 [Ruminococcus sp. YE71]